MTNQRRSKVRLVKCPRCAKILPEPEQVPLYTCGGCGTILQAKYYRRDNGGSNDIGHGPCDGETSSSNRTPSSADEQSIDQNRLMDQNEAENSNFVNNIVGEDDVVLKDKDSEQFTSENLEMEDVHRQNEHCDDTIQGDESQCSESKEQAKLQQSVVNVAIHTEDDQHERSSDVEFNNLKQVLEASVSDDSLANGNKDDDAFSESRKEHIEDKNSPENILIDDDNCHDMKRPVAVAVVYENGNVLEDSHEILLADEIGSGDIRKSVGDAALTVEEGNEKDQNDDVEQLRTKLESIDVSETPLSNDDSRIVYVDSTRSIESNSSVSATSSAIDLMTAEDLGSTKIVKEPQFESNSDDKLAETAGQIRKIVSFNDSPVYGPHNVCLNKKPDRLETVNTHKKDRNMLKMGPISLTKQSHVYERRASSVDAHDDQNLEQQELFRKGTLPEIDESSEWSDRPTSRTYRSWRTRNQPKNPSQVLLDEKLKNSLSDEENRIPVRRFPHKVPRYWSSEMANETGSSSSYIHDDIFTHRMHYPPYHYQDSEPRLQKWYSQKGNVDRNKRPEASWKENEFLPKYHSYETSREFHHRSVRHSFVDRRRRTESWSQIGNLPPKAYSGELFNGRYPNPEPYMHRWSAQLPQYMPVSSSQQGYGASRKIMWDPHDSYLENVQQYEEPAFYPRPYDHAIRRPYIRERQKGTKRFSRPMAGGAPFVACYFCFKVLQLPEEFLYSRRSKGRNHQIKCGNCSRILEFSLEKVSCLAPVKTNVVSSSYDEGGSSVPSKQVRVTLQMAAKKKSPLHSLMGYPSPHDMINDKDIKESQ